MKFDASIKKALVERDDEIDRLKKEVEEWKYAFAAQSRKLQSVLHIPGVREELRRDHER